jgi:hypothetical protein
MFRKHIGLAIFLSCIALGVWAEEKSQEGLSEKFIVQIDPSSWIPGSFKISPDGRRIAYIVRVGEQQAVVIDGKEEKPYDAIGEGNPVFSPDSRQVAYGARKGLKGVVVVSGSEQKPYDDIGSGKILFSPTVNG